MTEQNNPEKKIYNPFKGPDSYTELDQLNFFGREPEKNELIKLLEQNTLTLLYSRSGVGKSSLIKAGLKPILKKSKLYFPVYVRLTDNLITDATPTFSSAIVKLIIEEAKKKNKGIIETEYPTVTELLYSNNFIQFNDKERVNVNAVPVIIFDQFEEIFSLKFKGINDLIIDLSCLIEGKIPGVDKINENEKSSCKIDFSKHGEDELNTLKNILQQNVKWFRFIFSFRDEYLPHFESLMDKIPSIFKMSGRLNLQPFSIELAESVINKISKTKESEEKIGIEIDKNTCRHLARIISTSDKQFETGFFILKKEVQPFMLSLVCKDLYPKITGEYKDTELLQAIEREDSSKIDDIISKYTEDIFTKVSRDTRKFIEEYLITDDDKRKLFALSDVKNEKVLSEVKDLSMKQELRFLNIVDYSNTSNIEILHDRLLKPLLVSRMKRREEEDKDILEQRAAKTRNRLLLYFAIAFVVGISVLYLLLNSYRPFLEGVNEVRLQKLSTDINKNSIGALANIMEYQKSVNKIGEIDGFDLLPNFIDPLMGTKENLNDSIVDHFRDVPFFISFPDTSALTNFFESGISSKYRYMFYRSFENEEQDNSFDNGANAGDNDTSTVKKDSTNSKHPNIRIDFYKFKNDLIPQYISLPSLSVLPSQSKSKYSRAQFSPDEKKFYTPSGGNNLLYQMEDIENEDIENDDLEPQSLPANNNDFKFYRFLGDWQLLNYIGDKGRLISKTTSPDKFIKIKNPKGIETLLSAYIVNDKIIYCWRDFTAAGKITNYFSDGVSDTPLVSIKGRRELPLFISNSIITLFSDTLRILNLQNFKLDSFKTEMKDPASINIVENKNQFAVSNYFGDVHIYNTENYSKPEFRFKFENPDSNAFYETMILRSPPVYGNKLFIYYQNTARIYDLDIKVNDTTYKHYDFKFLKMELGYVYFNIDASVTLIDRNRNIIKWYYQKESPENLEQLQNYIDYFLSMYGDKNFIFKQEFLETDSVEIKLMNAG